MAIHITFLGAAKTVTGSKYLVESSSGNWLVDCGLFQGLKQLRLKNREPLSVKPESIGAVILTHAHIDHSGYLPILVRDGFRGKIYCTPATERLCRILLPDSGRLQEEEAQYANRKGFSRHHPAEPLYTEKDAEESLKFLESVPFHKTIELSKTANAVFSPAGHILGAACIRLQVEDKSIAFSGDLGRQNDLVMRPPEPISKADYVMVEATYGARMHDTINPLDQLESVMKRTFGRGGVVVIPSFAVGRSQNLLYAIYLLKKANRIPDVPVYLNSPMAIDATGVFCEFQKEHRLTPEESRASCAGVTYVHDQEESKALNEKHEPMVVIAASGMATGGRVLHHLKAFGPDKRNTILFTGFQAAGTRGEALVHGAKSIKIHGQIVPIEAEIALMDTLSAHADQNEILTWLSGFQSAPKMTFITHGEPESSETLSKIIQSKMGWATQIPALMQRVQL